MLALQSRLMGHLEFLGVMLWKRRTVRGLLYSVSIMVDDVRVWNVGFEGCLSYGRCTKCGKRLLLMNF